MPCQGVLAFPNHAEIGFYGAWEYGTLGSGPFILEHALASNPVSRPWVSPAAERE
jgi:hypothetical protein